MNRGRRLGILLLTLAASLGYWLASGPEQRRLATPGTVSPDAPEFFAEDFTVWSMDETGTLRYRLSGRRMEQRQRDGARLLTAPVLLLQEQGTPHWVLQSETGWIAPDGDRVRLQGQVDLNRIAAPGRPPLDIRTSDVLVRVPQQEATSRTPARLEAPRYHAEGIGMTLNLARETLDLHRQVRGEYAPGP
ncbi:LPS export ABC transporter periplasmic protein LptC [Ectothiorhodospira mobilis]|uniref:LPS export ABC transporter periplasmic protein LptC n=1 Tax=Ectothiorhodospira mobilis TaxID=195064 RepID=UPI001EE7C0E0|nr:LPS export ABC transporter periplasmic protein LptC [Ectothiorhodospira mobilis]MCG5534558.1 LPS export ABC transporter periplasmic protein LptC [Ectothiorhodospira mobilis]